VISPKKQILPKICQKRRIMEEINIIGNEWDMATALEAER
jgi:hypothetical protein